VTEADLDSALKDWNFFDPKVFALPAGHVVQRLFDERHALARLEALCKACHDRTKRRKPSQQAGSWPIEGRD
jgi:5-methylcytosine-specific restriction endonuclease McrA